MYICFVTWLDLFCPGWGLTVSPFLFDTLRCWPGGSLLARSSWRLSRTPPSRFHTLAYAYPMETCPGSRRVKTVSLWPRLRPGPLCR